MSTAISTQIYLHLLHAFVPSAIFVALEVWNARVREERSIQKIEDALTRGDVGA